VVVTAFEAYSEIKRRIIELRMAPGLSFQDDALALDLGVSRAELRAALTRLRGDELVERVAVSVYRVTPVTLKSAEDLLSLRELLECEAVAMAAGAKVDVYRAHELHRLCDATAQAGPSSLRANTAFHAGLARAGGSDTLANVLERVLAQLERLFNLGVPQGAFKDDTADEHRALLAAVLAGDAAEAACLARAHADGSRRMVLDTIAWRESLVADDPMLG
jgi:DNA-binding GntR family transcriptional regulator